MQVRIHRLDTWQLNESSRGTEGGRVESNNCSGAVTSNSNDLNIVSEGRCHLGHGSVLWGAWQCLSSRLIYGDVRLLSLLVVITQVG